MIREQIKKAIIQALVSIAIDNKKVFRSKVPEVIVEHPIEKVHGDYSSGVALVLAGQTKQDPLKLAEEIRIKVENPAQGIGVIDKVDLSVVRPGFLNFYLKKEFLQKQVGMILEQGEDYGVNVETHGNASLRKKQHNQKTQVEFISANPTGPLTVGNARAGPYGDTLANILQKAGCQVSRAYYINDCGNQILKLGHSVLKDKQAVYQGDYIDKLHKTIKEKDAFKAGQKAAKIILEQYIKKTVLKAGIKFDQWYCESDLHESGEVDQVLVLLKKKKLIYKKQGAIWFKSSQFGDKRDRVLVKSDGAKTYLAGDLALHRRKFTKDKFNKVINIWGADHTGDVAGLQAGIEALGHKGKLDIIVVQFVTLIEKGAKKKLSKRSGTVVTLSQLLDAVGPDVMRFFFLQKSANTHLNFDLDLARQQSEKNPVFYVQYAYVRIYSILKKVKNKVDNKSVILRSEATKDLGAKLLKHHSELELIKALLRLPEIIEDTARDYQVHRLPTYALDLAASFHRFYKDCRVLGNADKNLDEARLALISATKIVLKNTLDLMGIATPDRM